MVSKIATGTIPPPRHSFVHSPLLARKYGTALGLIIALIVSLTDDQESNVEISSSDIEILTGLSRSVIQRALLADAGEVVWYSRDPVTGIQSWSVTDSGARSLYDVRGACTCQRCVARGQEAVA